jgi:hypothetical protein
MRVIVELVSLSRVEDTNRSAALCEERTSLGWTGIDGHEIICNGLRHFPFLPLDENKPGNRFK